MSKDQKTPEPPESWIRRLKRIIIGRARSPAEKGIFHKLSLIAFFAWIGLGADGLSSSCYGPPEAFLALGGHPHLGVFVALGTVLTIFVISSSYSQIIELFPSGGGGYLVASKLLSPSLGMVAGCALMVDYVLTITVSVSSGTDALFSFLPPSWQAMAPRHSMATYKIALSILVILTLTVMNLRGVRESVTPLVPIFIIFVLTHLFVIVYSLIVKMPDVGGVLEKSVADARQTSAELGVGVMLFMILHAYSMGAGTYTGIEAVSNGLPILREPRVQTGKRAMTYMWVSLSVVVVGLMLAYLLFLVDPATGQTLKLESGKTVNASLLYAMGKDWSPWAKNTFAIVTLLSEAALLYVAAQTGFLGGPRVLASMAIDRWFPTRLSMLSDRLVTHNGILLMSLAAMTTLLLTGGNIRVLVVLYSVNVFITFLLSQSGMVRHWWSSRGKASHWRKKLFINGFGAALTFLILIWVVVAKFREGGWATLLVTTGLVACVILIRRHYNADRQYVEKFNKLAAMAESVDQAMTPGPRPARQPQYNPNAKTAVVLVSGFNGLGMHTLLNVIRFFGNSFPNFVFFQAGVVDAGNFKGAGEVERLEQHVKAEVQRYIDFVKGQGYHAEGVWAVGADVVDELEKAAPRILKRFPQSVFFAGQLVFPKESLISRILHNYISFSMQRRLYRQGIPFVILPIRA